MLTLHRVEEEQGKTENQKPPPKRKFRLSLRDAGWFAFIYAIAFIGFRFDIRRHGVSFQHPMATGTSAWFALLFAIVMCAYWKIRGWGQ